MTGVISLIQAMMNSSMTFADYFDDRKMCLSLPFRFPIRSMRVSLAVL